MENVLEREETSIDYRREVPKKYGLYGLNMRNLRMPQPEKNLERRRGFL